WAYQRAHITVALTRGTADWLEANIPDVRTTVIPNAVNSPLPASEPVVVPPSREGPQRILPVGRLQHDKGSDLLLQAFKQLVPHFPDWDLIILGEGSERSALEEQVEQLELTDRVSLPGRVGNVADWYASADLYVLSSRVEGLSNTLLEAMASGLAPVAFDCETGPREIIRSEIDGVLVHNTEDCDAL